MAFSYQHVIKGTFSQKETFQRDKGRHSVLGGGQERRDKRPCRAERRTAEN